MTDGLPSRLAGSLLPPVRPPTGRRQERREVLMKKASLVVAVLGLVAILLAVYGRFHGAPTVTIMGCAHTASTMVLAGQTLFLIAIFIAVWDLQARK